MTYINRLLDLKQPLAGKSVFLIGPRQCGKSSFLRKQLPEEPALTINLLDRAEYLRFQLNPSLLKELVHSRGLTGRLVVIDEVQKLPEILDAVHLLIEEYGVRFLLTGSNARKLKRQGTNLLGGRARTRQMHGFLALELGTLFHSKNRSITACYLRIIFPPPLRRTSLPTWEDTSQRKSRQKAGPATCQHLRDS